MSLEKVKLDSGLTIYHKRIVGEQTNSVKMFVPYGSVDEVDGDEGAANILERCAHLETDDFIDETAIDMHAKLNGMSIAADAYYTRTVYHADGLSLEPNLAHLSQVLQHTHLPEQKVANELKAVQRDAMTTLDDINTMHTVAADNAMFRTPYGRKVIVFHDKLDFDVEKLQQLRQRYYKLGRMSLIVSGKAKLDEVVNLATRYFDADDEPYDTSNDTQLSLKLGEHHTTGLVRSDSQNVRIQVGYPMSPEFRELYIQDRLAFNVARMAISGACFQSLRYEKGVSYNGSVAFALHNHPDAWHISGDVTTDKENVDTARNVFDDIFSRNDTNYDDDALTGALAKFKYLLNRNLATATKHTDAHLSRLESYLEPADLSISRRKIDKLKVDDVRTAINKIIEHTTTVPKYTHLTGKRDGIGDVERIIEQNEFI